MAFHMCRKRIEGFVDDGLVGYAARFAALEGIEEGMAKTVIGEEPMQVAAAHAPVG